MGSRTNLLGADATAEERLAQSSEHNVTPETPPIFLTHARNDRGVVFENSVVMHEALRAAGVSTELQLYEEGGHGFGMGKPAQDCSAWTAAAAAWLAQRRV